MTNAADKKTKLGIHVMICQFLPKKKKKKKNIYIYIYIYIYILCATRLEHDLVELFCFTFGKKEINDNFLAHLSQRLRGELIGWQPPSPVAVHTFELEYFCRLLVDLNHSLSVARLWQGIACICILGKLLQNFGCYGN